LWGPNKCIGHKNYEKRKGGPPSTGKLVKPGTNKNCTGIKKDEGEIILWI